MHRQLSNVMERQRGGDVFCTDKGRAHIRPAQCLSRTGNESCTGKEEKYESFNNKNWGFTHCHHEKVKTSLETEK